MSEKISINSGELVLNKGSYGYQEVIDSFKDSENIIIITYSIHENMLCELYNMEQNKNITIVTNIPGRFETYFDNEGYKKNAKKKIEYAQHILDPAKFKSYITTYFNFNNHSKIIISDSHAYIGSQNFYGADSWECGVIINDKVSIKRIKEVFVEKILESSTLYKYNGDLSFIDDIDKELHYVNTELDEATRIANAEYYNVGIRLDNITLSKKTLMNILISLINISKIFSSNRITPTIIEHYSSFASEFLEYLKSDCNIKRCIDQNSIIDIENLYSFLAQNPIFYEKVLDEETIKEEISYEKYEADYFFPLLKQSENITDKISDLRYMIEEYIYTFYRNFYSDSSTIIDNTGI